MKSLFERTLQHFEITDFQKQILDYATTYREHFADKLLSEKELAEARRDGFYIGHHKTGLGEFLSYTPLPRFLKTHFPDCKVFVCKHRFAEALFRHDPYVDGVMDIAGREPIGTFREFGFGTHPQKRLRPFGIFAPGPVLPEIHISKPVMEKWREWKATLPLAGRKLVMVQSSGRTNPKLFSVFKWWSLLRPLRDEFYFVHLGNLRDQFIWAHRVMLKQWDMEEMAACLSQGEAFVGPNSGMMHFAAATRTNAVIMHNEAFASEMDFPTLGDNLALPKKVNGHLFHAYPQHRHLVIDRMWNEPPGLFAERVSSKTLRETLHAACLGSNPLWMELEASFSHPTTSLFS
jgi:ADP-heptose:LPS heptosyltransferase